MAGQQGGQGPLDRAVGSAVRGNSTAFGFSISVTLSFGMLSSLRGAPSVLEMFLFGVAAALAIAVLEAAVSRGFRVEIEQVSQRVDMLGTAMNLVSVAAAVGVATGVGEVVGGIPAWPAGAFAAASVYVLAESGEIFIAELIQGEEGRGEGEPEQGS